MDQSVELQYMLIACDPSISCDVARSVNCQKKLPINSEPLAVRWVVVIQSSASGFIATVGN